MDDFKQQDHTHDPSTGTTHGVPYGATKEESKGVPDSGRHESETAPIHKDAGKEQARDI